MADAMRQGRVSSVELTRQFLARIERLQPLLNAFITVMGEESLEEARLCDAELSRGQDHGPLHGIPIAHKDLLRTAGVRTTAGSKILRDYVPTYDAVIVSRLRERGGVCLGKTGLHEFAYGITSNNPHYGPIRNPWDRERIAGGSSGGAAVAVAAGMIPFATGTDTGGSIRVPASFCGVVGMKPTFGRISIRGVLPLGITQDHLGPITATVRDAAIAFQCMADEPSGFVPPSDIDLHGVRMGWPLNFFVDGVDSDVLASVRNAGSMAVNAGADVQDVRVPDMEALRWAALTTLLSEAAGVLKKFLPAHRKDFGEDVLAMVDQGLAIPAVDYLEAQKIRGKIRREYEALFGEIDCLITPTTPITAPKIGQRTVKINGETEEVRAVATRFTRGMNATGFPAISIPCGFSSSGMPIGLQIIADRGKEDKLLFIAAAMEDALGIAGRHPDVS